MTRGTDNSGIETDCQYAIPNMEAATARAIIHDPPSPLKVGAQEKSATLPSEVGVEAASPDSHIVLGMGVVALVAVGVVVHVRQQNGERYQAI